MLVLTGRYVYIIGGYGKGEEVLNEVATHFYSRKNHTYKWVILPTPGYYLHA